MLAGALKAYPYDLQPMEIRIDASDRAAAWATPDDRIFVTLGLLENLESEGQLATALAHEAGHVQLGHFSRQEYFDGQRAAVTMGTGIAMIGLAVADLRTRNGGGGLQVYGADPQGTQLKIVQAAAVASLINGISDDVLNTHWSRRQEQQSDLFAADLIIAAGYHPRAPADLFQQLGKLWGQERDFESFLQAEQERMGKELAALENPFLALRAAPAKMFEVGLNVAGEAWRRFGLTHIDPEERQAAMLEYARREYKGERAKAAEREAEAARYEEALRTRLPTAVRERHRAAQQAQRLLAEGNVAEAEQKAQFAISGPTSGSAHTRAVMYMVRSAQGRHDEALANLESIARDEFRPRRVFEFQAAEYLRRQRYAEALRVLDAGAAQFATAEPFLAPRIDVQLAMGDVEGAWETYATCRSTASGANRSACDLSIEGAPKVAEADSYGLSADLAKMKGFFGSFLPAGDTPQ